MSKGDSKLLKFFRKIGQAFINLKKVPSKIKKVKDSLALEEEEPKKEIPSFLKGFFERRNAEWPEYVMLKVQISMILLFISSSAFAVLSNYWLTPAFLLGGFLLSGYLVYLVLTEVKNAFRRDYPAYRGFVIMVLFIVFVLVSAIRYLSINFMESFLMTFVPAILAIGSALGAFSFFRLKYGRDFTFGTVKETKGSRANVKINYDIRSNVKNGLYLLEALPEISKGDEVKVGVDRTMLGLGGSKPTVILEKIEE